MTVEEMRTKVVVGADGKLKDASFSPGLLVKTEPIGPNRIRETFVSSTQMSPRDIPIMKEVFKKYGDLQKPEAQAEFFRRAKHWRRKMNQRLNKPMLEPEKEVFEGPAESVARQWQLALCDLAHGDFSRLSEHRLRNCAILSALHREDRTLEIFSRVLEAIKKGE